MIELFGLRSEGPSSNSHGREAVDETRNEVKGPKGRQSC